MWWYGALCTMTSYHCDHCLPNESLIQALPCVCYPQMPHPFWLPVLLARWRPWLRHISTNRCGACINQHVHQRDLRSFTTFVCFHYLLIYYLAHTYLPSFHCLCTQHCKMPLYFYAFVNLPGFFNPEVTVTVSEGSWTCLMFWRFLVIS